MGKQKHDLGVRKRAINALHNGERPVKPDKPIGSGCMGPDIPQPENYYGPPLEIREKAHALRQLSQPIAAQAVIDDWHFGRKIDWTLITRPVRKEYDPRARGKRGHRE
jgi:hypothetical protein